ncbi:hypothetical protein [Neglectibacter caecimuris]|uniref:hypothetical protein n=1 Tax=Neglectibacter caecimuris TaxID=3093658 RepID=UPI002AC93E82|nr:hypothetical protein [Neglectibacter sp. M00184]
MKEGVQKIVFAEQSQSSWSLRSKLLKGEWFCLCGAKPIFLEFAKQTPQRRMVLSLRSKADLPGVCEANSSKENGFVFAMCGRSSRKVDLFPFRVLRGASSLNPLPDRAGT